MGCYGFFGRPFQKTVPLVYDESVSYEQQIAAILGKLRELAETEVTDYDLALLKDAFAKDQADQSAALRWYIEKVVQGLEAEIAAIVDEGTAWNVTTGAYERGEDAVRDLFNWATVHAVTVGQLAELDYTCETLAESGLTCRGLAVWSWTLTGLPAERFVPYGVYTSEPVFEVKPLTVGTARDAQVSNGYMKEGEK